MVADRVLLCGGRKALPVQPPAWLELIPSKGCGTLRLVDLPRFGLWQVSCQTRPIAGLFWTMKTPGTKPIHDDCLVIFSTSGQRQGLNAQLVQNDAEIHHVELVL